MRGHRRRPFHNTSSAAALSRFGLGHVRKHTPFVLTLSSLHLWHSAKSLPKKRCFFGERPFCKGLRRSEGDKNSRVSSATLGRGDPENIRGGRIVYDLKGR